MSNDIVKRLRDPSLGSPRWMDTMAEAADFIEAQDARIAELEAALRKIRNLARTGKPHPMSRKTDYFQISSAALKGGEDE